ncbi:bifunctional DNA primase/polymerase [uncultured Thomasclavelia sp.]|uniref:bifunctional DNA primase/polymerase n=1 Tax=uncultured Thomasclavelia sp. TaxID=3025759 RepID=UPI0025926B17|nr:bifunctional DNA primase/polymerase [uncultured Thomasclavelia sp.]
MNPMLDHALNYAQEHFKIFPLKVNSKSEQILNSWENEATEDLHQVESWWSDHPDANIGVKTGEGFIVIVVNNSIDRNGKEVMEPYIEKFPKTRIVRTPNDDWHFYYDVDKDIPCQINIYEGIDIQGEGGYVVGAGSQIDDKKYYISLDTPIAKANDAVYEFINEKSNHTKQLKDFEKIYKGKRNDYLLKIACFLQQKGLTDKAIEVCIQKENEQRCVPILETDEVHKICESALSYNKGFIQTKRELEYGGRYTVTELLTMEISDEPDIVEDMISVGLTLLGAPQKAGKTFFGLQLAEAISTGKDFLGKKVMKGSSLYLAFEDHRHKIQRRLKKMNIKENEHFVIEILKADHNYNLERRIQEELLENPDLKVVIVDTFAKMRRSKDRDYDSEYAEATEYHELAFRYNLAIIMITHVKKEIDPNNPFDAIYGSRGLPAGSDSILVMFKRNFLSKNRQLAIQGKDIPDDEFTLFQNENCTFEVVENDFDENIDENLSKVVNYIVRNKVYEGSHETLCSKLSLQLRGKGLQILLTKNKEYLADTYIKYEVLPRTNKARQMRFTYEGDERL